MVARGCTIPTSVCSGEAFGAGGGGEAGTELWGAALNRRGICLPGNVSVSSQPPRLHMGPALPESSRQVQVLALPPSRSADARVRRHASGPAQSDTFPTDPPPPPRPQGRDWDSVLGPSELTQEAGWGLGPGVSQEPGGPGSTGGERLTSPGRAPERRGLRRWLVGCDPVVKRCRSRPPLHFFPFCFRMVSTDILQMCACLS